MPRVLILSHMYPNAVSPLGGIFVRQQAAALAQLGVGVNVIAPVPWVPEMMAGRGKWGGYPSVPLQEQPDGFPVFHPRVLEFPRSFFFEYYPKTYIMGLRKVIEKQFQQGIDLIHAHVAHPDGAAALSFARRFQVPLVVTIHGQDFAYTLNRSRTCAESVRRTLREAERVILVSEKLKTQYDLETWAELPAGDNGDPLAKYRIIYNGVDLDDVVDLPEPGPKPETEPEMGLELEHEPEPDSGKVGSNGPSRHRLLTVGFLRPDKGHAVVLKALPELVREFPDLEYRIVGDGEERQALEALTNQLNLRRHVVFLGSLPHPEAMREMAKCDVFILPSWREAFGVVYLEAMAHGKPIIGTLGEGISEILAQNDVGLAVPPKDVVAVKNALRELFSNPVRAKNMGARGKSLVTRRFTWQYNAQKTLDVYHEAVKSMKI